MGNYNILVIDDSNTNLVLLEALLTSKGYTVCSSLSAKEAIESMKNIRPDLIYLDLVMPEVDGFEFMKIIKSNPEWSSIPIVVLSAITDADIRKKSMDLGIVEYITKPLNIHKLVDLTREILGEQKS
jgi:CheY-like chemotaxis protein